MFDWRRLFCFGEEEEKGNRNFRERNVSIIMNVLEENPVITLQDAQAVRDYIVNNPVGEALMYIDWCSVLYDRLESEIRDAHVLSEFVDYAVDIREVLATAKQRIIDYYNAHPGDIEGTIKDRDVAAALLLSAPKTIHGEVITKLERYAGDDIIENEDFQDWLDYVEEMRKSSPGTMKIAFKKLPKLKGSGVRMGFHRMQ